MPDSRRARGFERAGAIPLERLGLPRARAREMLLTRAWERAVGPTLAAHSRAVRVGRGVMEVEVEAGRWADTLAAWLPRLAGAVARAHPELGVKRCRLLRTGSKCSEEARPIELTGGFDAPGAGESTAAGESPVPREKTAEPDERSAEERLHDLAQRYLQRGGAQNQ